jgi:hypothetical protein
MLGAIEVLITLKSSPRGFEMTKAFLKGLSLGKFSISKTEGLSKEKVRAS